MHSAEETLLVYCLKNLKLQVCSQDRKYAFAHCILGGKILHLILEKVLCHVLVIYFSTEVRKNEVRTSVKRSFRIQ